MASIALPVTYQEWEGLLNFWLIVNGNMTLDEIPTGTDLKLASSRYPDPQDCADEIINKVAQIAKDNDLH